MSEDIQQMNNEVEDTPDAEGNVESPHEEEVDEDSSHEEEGDEDSNSAHSMNTEIEIPVATAPVETTRKSSRATKQPEKLQVNPKNKTHSISTNARDLSDPKNIKEALSRPDNEKWKVAIRSELDSIK